MSQDELQKFHNAIEAIEKLGGLFRAAIAAAVSMCAVVAGIAIWVSATSAQVAQTKEDLHSLIVDRADSYKEWSRWRASKDDIDSRLTALMESQQRSLTRLDGIVEQRDERK
jgi:hypothetical protein